MLKSRPSSLKKIMDQRKKAIAEIEKITGRKIDLPEGTVFPIRLVQILEKQHPKKKEVLSLGKWGKLDLVRKTWERKDRKITLTEKEVDILGYLKDAGKTVAKEDLLTKIFKYSPEITTHTIETHIYRLRKKMEAIGAETLLKTENNGYSLSL